MNGQHAFQSKFPKSFNEMQEISAEEYGFGILALFAASSKMARALRRNDIPGETKMLVLMSEIALRLCIVPLARAYALDALRMCRHYRMFDLECHILCVLTRIALASNRAKESLAYLQEARDFLLVTEDTHDAFEFHETAGQVWMTLNDHAAAVSHLKQALGLASDEDPMDYTMLFGNLMLECAFLGDIPKALNYGAQALEYAPTPDLRTNILVELAHIHSFCGEYDVAADYLQRAFGIWSEDELSRTNSHRVIRLAVQEIRQTPELGQRVRISSWVPSLLAARPPMIQLPTPAEIADRLLDPTALRDLLGALVDEESIAYLSLLASDIRLPDGVIDETRVVQVLCEAIEMVGCVLADLDEKNDANGEFQSASRSLL